MLNGYKTYICVALGIGSATMYGLEYITVEQFILLLNVFGFGSIAALRSAIKKMIRLDG